MKLIGKLKENVEKAENKEQYISGKAEFKAYIKLFMHDALLSSGLSGHAGRCLF